MAILIESHFFPSTSVIKTMVNADVVYLELHENYQKRSYRNKCKIQGPNGTATISVPLSKGKNDKMVITDVGISYDTHWDSIFLKTLQSNYGKSPYLIFYIDEIQALMDQKYDKLIDLNLAILEWIKATFQLPIQLVKTESYETTPSKGVQDCRQQFMLKDNPKNIDLIPYPQLFEDRFGFVPNLSILDAIFCTGPELIKYVS